MLRLNRLFRVFVSSPFEDLTGERNALQREVFRGLSKICESHEARFQPIDLRWGVSPAASLDQSAMEICFAEIERCRRTELSPDFIVLLGNRYGSRPLQAAIEAEEFETVRAHIAEDLVNDWYRLDGNAIPPEYRLLRRTGELVEDKLWHPIEERLQAALREGARHASLPEAALLRYEASATHQEIARRLSGTTAAERKRVFAFCHASASPDVELNALKSFLSEQLGDNLVEFDDSATLCARARTAIETAINSELQRLGPADPLEGDAELQNAAAEQCSLNFAGRQPILDAIAGSLAQSPIVVVHGPSGSGKSAVMARASTLAAQTSGAVVIRRFIGASPDSSIGVSLLRSLCREIAAAYSTASDEPGELDELATAFRRRLELATAERPLIVFLDAVNELPAADPASALTWLPETIPPHSRIVLSSIEVPAALAHARAIAVGEFSAAEAEEALSMRLAAAGRTLQPWQRQTVLDAFARCPLPLYLDLASGEAQHWRSFDGRTDCILGERLEGIIDQLLDRLSRDHGQLLLDRALGCLAASRYGLAEEELLDVLAVDDDVWNEIERGRYTPPERQLPVVVWSRLHFDLAPYLATRSVQDAAVVAIYHRRIVDQWASRQREDWEAIAHRHLASLFRRAGDPAGDGSWTGSRRASEEVVHHLDRLGDDGRKELREILLSTHYQEARCAHGDVHALLADLRRLASSDDEIRELHDFLFAHAQRLRRSHDHLFALMHHEGPPRVRARADALLAAGRWRRPWLRTAAVPLPAASSAPAAAMALRLLTEHRFPNSSATALAADAQLAFRVKVLGRISVVDARSMQELADGLAIPLRRILGLFAAADARSLAIAFENGDLVILDLELSADRRVLRKTSSRGLQYLVPETEPPVMRWHGRELLMQRPDGSVAIVHASGEDVLALPADCRGELSGAIFFGDAWHVTIRQSGNTWLWRCGTDDRLLVPRADAVCLAPVGDDGIAVGFSDRTLRLFETAPELRQTAETRTGLWPDCVVGWDGGVLWFEEDKLRYRRPDGAVTRVEDASGLLPQTIFLRIRAAARQPDRSLLLLSDSNVCQVRVESAAAAKAGRVVEKPLIDGDDAVYAIEKRGDALWIVDSAKEKDVLLVAEARARHFHALDGRGHLLTVNSAGGGVIADLADHRLEPVRSPIGANSLIARDGTFWLADRFGGIHRLRGREMHREALVEPENAGGGRIWNVGASIVWQGKNSEFGTGNPSADVQETLLFFEVHEGFEPLSELGARVFPKEDGRIQCVSRGSGEDVLVFFRGHSEHGLCAKIGTPPALLGGTERTVPLDFDASILDCIPSAEENRLYVLCEDHDVRVVDLATMTTCGRLAATRPFTTIGGNGVRGVAAVEARERIYRCWMEVPDGEPV